LALAWVHHPFMRSASLRVRFTIQPPIVSAPDVSFSLQGNNLILTWPAGWSLQSATNVPGPYFDVPGATPPYTNDMFLEQQQRFFRLRQIMQ